MPPLPDTLEKTSPKVTNTSKVVSATSRSGFTRPPQEPPTLLSRIHKVAPVAVIALSLSGLIYLVERIRSPRAPIDPQIQAIVACDGTAQPPLNEAELGLSALEVDMDIKPQQSTQSSNSLVQVRSSLMNDGSYARGTAPEIIARDTAIRNYLANLRVTGVRTAQENSRILIGDDIYTINSTLNSPYKLRLTDITPKELTFIDDRGIEYQKSL